MSVHFKDADGVVHSIPSDLTHFEPNDRSDPYVLEKIAIEYVSGAKKEYRVEREYFETLVSFADEISPAYPGKFVPGLQMGAFVRFVGSRRAIPAFTNYLLQHGSMAAILLCSLRGVWAGPDVLFGAKKCLDGEYCCFTFTCMNNPDIVCRTRDEYVATLSTIVDECEHYREVVDFVRYSTNETYAQKLESFMISIDGDEDYDNEVGIMYEVNPLTTQFTMRWFARELCKVPQHVVDKVRVIGFTDPEHAERALEILKTRPLYCRIGESLVTKVSEFPADGDAGTYMCHPSLLSHMIGSYICDVCTLTADGNLEVTVSWGFELTVRDPVSTIDMLESMLL